MGRKKWSSFDPFAQPGFVQLSQEALFLFGFVVQILSNSVEDKEKRSTDQFHSVQIYLCRDLSGAQVRGINSFHGLTYKMCWRIIGTESIVTSGYYEELNGITEKTWKKVGFLEKENRPPKKIKRNLNRKYEVQKILMGRIVPMLVKSVGTRISGISMCTRRVLEKFCLQEMAEPGYFSKQLRRN